MKNKKLPSVVSLMILTLITSIFWMMFTIYRSFTKPTPTVVPDEVINQIVPKLDTETIEMMKTKL
ncbi:MAG: hypothetical protein AAB778_01945 [Patescibacteria group bacterium]